MKDKNCIILRGVSGSGKTTFTNLIAEPKCVCCADDYFVDKTTGEYKFDFHGLGAAHGACREKFVKALNDDKTKNIIVANTNTKESDYKYYVDQAEKVGCRVTFVILENRHGGKNVHGVPEETLQRQENTILSNIKLR